MRGGKRRGFVCLQEKRDSVIRSSELASRGRGTQRCTESIIGQKSLNATVLLKRAKPFSSRLTITQRREKAYPFQKPTIRRLGASFRSDFFDGS
jgi:hypothetical protein